MQALHSSAPLLETKKNSFSDSASSTYHRPHSESPLLLLIQLELGQNAVASAPPIPPEATIVPDQDVNVSLLPQLSVSPCEFSSRRSQK